MKSKGFIIVLFLAISFLYPFNDFEITQKDELEQTEQEQIDEIDSVNYKAIITEAKTYPAAIEFSLYSPNLKRTISLSDYTGKTVVIFFWASWDRYSREQIDMMANIQKKLNKKEFEIIAIALDSAEETRRFFDKKPELLNFITLCGNKYLMETYNVWGLPAIFIIDKEQKIRKKFSGYVSDKTLLKELKKVL